MSNIISIVCHQFRYEKNTAKFWLGIGMGMAICANILALLLKYSQIRGEPINVMEGFLYCLLDPQNVMLTTLGYMFVISDAPFINEWTLQIAVRVQRKKWALGCIIYILLQAALYYLVIFLFSVCILQKNGYIGLSWSVPTVQAAQNVNVTISNFGISFPYWEFMKHNTVLKAVILTLWGNVLYSGMIGAILYLGNLNNNYALGTWMAMIVHLSAYIARRDWKWEWSLQIWASPAENRGFVPFYIILLVLAVISLYKIKKVDYQNLDKNI